MADTWLQTCPAQHFCFSHPADWQPKQLRMVDSTAGIMQGENVQLSYDYGIYSDNFSALPDAKRQALVIDGFAAELITSPGQLALYIGKVEHIKVMNADMALSMMLTFSGEVDRNLAEQVFKSVRFTRPHD